MPEKFYKKLFHISGKSKNQDGLTIVEVIIAFLIIAIISAVLIRGTIVSVTSARINKAKTEALAVANEKIEIIKSIGYDILKTTPGEVTGGDGVWIFDEYPQLEVTGYDVSYEVSWVEGEVNSYKQLKVSVSRDPMKLPVEVVTQLYPPVGEEATGGNIFPAPDNLTIQSDAGEGEGREIVLVWTAPETERDILRYNIYCDSEWLASSLTEYYPDHPGDDDIHFYYVTAVYEGDRESFPSNTISTGIPSEYPAPQNLNYAINGTGDGRTVYLTWDAPLTELVIAEYKIWRDEIWIASVSELTYSEVIGITNYTYVISAVYEGGYESDPSNPVTTE